MLSLPVIILLAACCVAAFLVTVCRVTGWRRLLRHRTLADIVFTALSVLLLAGTLTGLLVAILGGLIMAVFLSAWAYFADGLVKRGRIEEWRVPRPKALKSCPSRRKFGIVGRGK